MQADERSARAPKDDSTTPGHGAYERILAPVIFRIGHGDAEQAHDRTVRALAGLGRVGPARAALGALFARHRQPATVAGITFPGTIGLAAGMDKTGLAAGMWGRLGFGFAEFGTVTPQAQPGNPRPRLFRLPSSEALINRMGFNNDGADALAGRLRHASGGNNPARDVPVGVSIGKAAHTPNDEAVTDYLRCFDRLRDVADYVAVNVSSPNTGGLRSLQDRQSLTELLGALANAAGRTDRAGRTTPIFVKVSPDLADEALDELLDVCHRCGIAGLIAVNTTTRREALRYADLELAPQAGGLSGHPLARRARRVVSFLTARSTLPVIGAGGIAAPDDARAMLDAGASLLQVFTGFIYHGPALIDRINRITRRRHGALPARCTGDDGRAAWHRATRGPQETQLP